MKKVEEWSLGYEILRPLGKLIHNFSYKNIKIKGIENIPKNQAVLIAPNHQNALSDSLAILVHTKMQPVFLGRADMFKNKFAASFLSFFKISPVFRVRDGKETLDKNHEVFDNCVNILKKHKMLCIYPEASHIGMKRMNPHKKAIPRIAFLTAEATNFELNVKILPVGIYYSHYYNFRRNLIVEFGKPLNSSDYYELYKQKGEAKATLTLRNDLFAAIKELVVYVPEKASYDLFDQGFEFYKPQLYQKLGLKNHTSNSVVAEKYLTDKVVTYFENDDSQKEDLVKKAQQYKRLKKRLNLSEKELALGPIGFFGFLVNILLSLLLLPLSVYGTVANGWLFYLTRYPYRKKVKDTHFFSTISFGLSFFLFPAWFIAQFFILLVIFNSWYIALLLLAFSMPSGIIAWEMLQLILRSFHRLNYNKLKRKQNKHLLQLLGLRTELAAFFKKTIEL
ncbi:MAG: 1-acyl-sn-glycerol-3-phosphate acyltransferase [Prolixibacteraceae bacterium]|jgi:1-acyl-sn-glycerol-3-phosphate acyltransferase|nr:1-acyl-sn-glycerol-3-phosphate acyltransferase [Prolixibacteraceae bacterium]